MNIIKQKDKLLQQIPKHIRENHPRFVDFLMSYYEWVALEQNPREVLTSHLSRLDFTNSFDLYIEQMQSEYLTNLPKNDDISELMIKLSKLYNQSRGSRASLKFLLKLLYGYETELSFYNPKDDIFELSASTWINNEYRVIVNYTDLPEQQLMTSDTFVIGYLDRYNIINANEIEIIFIQPSGMFNLDDVITIGDHTYTVTQTSEQVPGFYVTQTSFLSSTSKLQDSDYYSKYSFVLRTNTTLEEYKELIEQTIVPAGFKLFLEIE